MLWKSDHPAVEIPTNLTTWEWAFESAQHAPIRYSPNDHGYYENAITKERLYYGQVRDHAIHVSTTLIQEYGFHEGDTISLFANNSIWYPVALWATVRVGGRVNGASPAYTAEEMTYALRVAKTKFLFTLPGSLPVAIVAARNAGLPERNIFLLEGEGYQTNRTTIQKLIEAGKKYSPAKVCGIPAGKTNKDICGYLNFSSGTTGLPKAVMLSHHNLIAQCHQLRQLQVVEPGERYRILAVTPLFHITGLVRYIHYPIFMNGTSIMLPSFDMRNMLESIIDYRIRELILVPPILVRLVKDPVVTPYLPALRATVHRWSSGSAPLSPEIITQLHARFPATGFRQGYGATESTACISAHPPTHFSYEYAATGGKLVANTEAIVLDLDDPHVRRGVGQTGEICARGPQIAMGYLDNEAATGSTFDAQGFFHTGDVGHIDEEGLIHIEDRIKEMIKVRGQQVAPAELEDLLQGHHAVEECAVLGIPDEYSGEKPKAYVVLKPGTEPSESLGRALLRKVQSKKVRYKWLVEVEFTGAIPKSPTGKVLRRILKANDRQEGRARGMIVRQEETRAKL